LGVGLCLIGHWVLVTLFGDLIVLLLLGLIEGVPFRLLEDGEGTTLGTLSQNCGIGQLLVCQDGFH
jgi:hypothetical protein